MTNPKVAKAEGPAESSLDGELRDCQGRSYSLIDREQGPKEKLNLADVKEVRRSSKASNHMCVSLYSRFRHAVATTSVLLFLSISVSGHAATDPINVLDFGAAGDGIQDDTNAIQRALRALPLQGGTVLLPAGRYRIRRTLSIGDGSLLRSSRSHNIALLGSGIGSTADSGFPDDGATELIWDGNAHGTMIEVNGPISAVRVSDIRFSARNSAGACLEVHHAYYSSFQRLQCSDFTKKGFLIDSYSAVPSVAIGANNNRWEQIFAWSAVPGVTGLVVGGIKPTGPGILGVSGNRFDTVTVHVNGENATGVELRFTDFDTFTQVGVLAERGNGLKVSTLSEAPGFPGAVWFYQSSFAGRNSVSGGHDWTGSQKIVFWPWHDGDGEVVPTQPWAAGITSSGRLFGFFPW